MPESSHQRIKFAQGRFLVRDWIASAIVWTLAMTVVVMFCWMIGDLIRHGISQLSLSFLFDSARNAGREGGIAPMIISTLMIVGVCMVVAIPIGLGTAVLLSEYSGDETRFGHLIRRSLDALAAVPSIVFGLFGNALFCIYLGMGFSILSGGLTLACMVLPIFIRSAEVGLRNVPDDYRSAAAALGMSRTTTLFRVVLPISVPALVAGFVLGLGRAMSETAALIFTSGYVDRMPESFFDSGRAMSVHIYDLAMNVPGGNPNAYGAALVLLGMLLIINVASGYLGRRFSSRTISIQGNTT